MTSKNIGLLFTGGLDSTYLLFKLLSEGHDVTPIYIKIGNNKNKIENELLAINNILNYIKHHKPEYSDRLHDLYVSYECHITQNLNYDKPILAHPLIFINAILFMQGLFDEFQIAYVGGDDVLPHLDDLMRIYKSYGSFFTNKLTKIKFPLIKYSKKFDLLPNIPEDLRSIIYACEEPELNIDFNPHNEFDKKYIICNNCDACVKYRNLYLSEPYLMKDYTDLVNVRLAEQVKDSINKIYNPESYDTEVNYE